MYCSAKVVIQQHMTVLYSYNKWGINELIVGSLTVYYHCALLLLELRQQHQSALNIHPQPSTIPTSYGVLTSVHTCLIILHMYIVCTSLGFTFTHPGQPCASTNEWQAGPAGQVHWWKLAPFKMTFHPSGRSREHQENREHPPKLTPFHPFILQLFHFPTDNS